MATESDDLLALFLRIGLAETNAKGAVKNQKFCASLKEVITEADSNAQLDGGVEYLKGLGDGAFHSESFEIAAGVGIRISQDQISVVVEAVIQTDKERLMSERYQVNMNQLIGRVTQSLKFADGTAVKNTFDKAILKLLGPKTEADLAAEGSKKKKTKKPKPPERTLPSQSQSIESSIKEIQVDPYAFYTRPEDNHQVHTTIHYSSGEKLHISNSEEQLRNHLEATEGKVYTRFPPEPNGYLHIGHAKAMFVSFGLAEKYNGHCYLRYDDTNPEAEKLEYITHIQEIVAWMGWKPWKITFSSEYFDQLYQLAVKMIRSGHAYVDHQTADEIKEYRQKLLPSPWRDRPIAESLKLFEDMRRGLIDEGDATLRMKQDPKNENPNMYDLIAYRVKFTPHPHVGDKWCIYPSYDFTHCIVDALENITHSLCTLEFEVRRVSYYWLLEVLGLYKPVEYEYSRLNITYNVLSKRKLKALVMGGYVRGWDDPRLYTLAGLRRRGVTPVAMNNFCKEMGITRSDNDIQVHRLEYHIRQDLDLNSPRTMAVLRPLKIRIVNMGDDHVETVHGKSFPGRTDDSYPLPFSKTLFIEETDFREQDEKGYFGLAPGKSVMLRYAYPITCQSVVRDEGSGAIAYLECTYEPEFHSSGVRPPKGVLNWCESVGEYSGDSWLDQINPTSEVVIKGGLGNPTLRSSMTGDRLQFERLGYFCVDCESTESLLVVNRTVTLRDSLPKSLK